MDLTITAPAMAITVRAITGQRITGRMDITGRTTDTIGATIIGVTTGKR